MQGKLIVISAPSGAGKTTIVKRLMELQPSLEFSVSATSRPMRGEEADGRDYFFLSPEEFRKNIEDRLFLEWEEVYENQYYGTLKSEVERIWKSGRHVLFDVDVKGGLNIKNKYPELTLAIFISPPSLETLRERLIGRKTDSASSISRRLEKAAAEMSFAGDFDKIVVNDKLEEAVQEVNEAVGMFLEGKGG